MKDCKNLFHHWAIALTFFQKSFIRRSLLMYAAEAEAQMRLNHPHLALPLGVQLCA